MKGLLGFYCADVKELRLPLMVTLNHIYSCIVNPPLFICSKALIDHLGFRLIAISILPVNSRKCILIISLISYLSNYVTSVL